MARGGEDFDALLLASAAGPPALAAWGGARPVASRALFQAVRAAAGKCRAPGDRCGNSCRLLAALRGSAGDLLDLDDFAALPDGLRREAITLLGALGSPSSVILDACFYAARDRPVAVCTLLFAPSAQLSAPFRSDSPDLRSHRPRPRLDAAARVCQARGSGVGSPPPRPRKAMKVGSHAQAGRRGRGPDVDGRGAHPRRGPVGRGPHLRRTGGILVAGGGGGARHNDGGVPAPTPAGIARTILVVDVVLVVAALLEAQQGSATRAGAVGAWVYVAGVTSGTLEN